ncbi:FtsX-like permease family protein [Anaerocolumna sp. MB42-C2]|uniref:FtsX-like permease family protein n=1 Tax=Anaerocolumna sp. MB42-C2 TaxID=3070997 RepID=UPI0027E20A03|nr:ABC transporter permease [Anaerocolumna sp. MB42-C2]WMJ89119.1 ABC transporter permease [Anaerocolumna sp. MB42-C2]
MNIFVKSIRQMLRTPLRTALFLLLLLLSSSLLALGAGLYVLSSENVKRLDEVFVTIGIVKQKPAALHERKVWDAEKKEFVSQGLMAEYGSVISDKVLDFDGANYIQPPVKRPYYGAYNPDWIVHEQNVSFLLVSEMRQELPIMELEPVEDCIPDHPVKLKIKRVLYGTDSKLEGWETLLFCDHYNPNPQPMYAGKRYVMALAFKRGHNNFPKLTVEYFPDSFTNNLREYRSSPREEEPPVTSTQYRSDGERIPDRFPMTAPWDEVTDGFYDTPRGQRWLELAKAMYLSEQTIPVVPTDSTELLMSFYNGNSNIIEGRDITEEEYREGQRICLISREFAKMNGFSVGDKLTLPLYYADYRDSAGRDFSPGDKLLGISDHLLNAQGRHYEVFDENEYTIAGIYNEINKVARSTGYDMPSNAVVIPAASVKNSDEDNILDYGPMMGYNTVFRIPNGTIESYMKVWEKQGVDDLEITFYDKGYTKIKEGLEQIKEIALALFISGILTATLILLFFCQIFIGKQKKRTAIERSLGMNKRACTISLLSGIIVIALLGSIAGTMMGYLLTGNAMKQFTGQVQAETFSTLYSNWAGASDSELNVQLDTSLIGPWVYILTGVFMVILSAGISLARIRGNLKSEPLKLLSMRDT